MTRPATYGAVGAGINWRILKMPTKRKRTRPKKRNLVQVVSGKWYAIASGGKPYEEQCCDCGLVHDIQYKVENGRIWQRWDGNEEKSRLARKTSSQRYVPK
jgi:hypothetical protein